MRLVKIAVAIGLLFFVFFGSIPDGININPLPPDEVDEVVTLIDVEKPSDDILSKVRPVASLVTSVEDKAKIALFNHEFASRVDRYIVDCQQLNDLYTNASKKFFGDSIKGKYPLLSSKLVELFESVLTDENHVISTEEKDSISKLFNGLAWALLEK